MKAINPLKSLCAALWNVIRGDKISGRCFVDIRLRRFYEFDWRQSNEIILHFLIGFGQLAEIWAPSPKTNHVFLSNHPSFTFCFDSWVFLQNLEYYSSRNSAEQRKERLIAPEGSTERPKCFCTFLASRRRRNKLSNFALFGR